MASLLTLIGLQVIFAVALYLRGGWNIIMALINTALAFLTFRWFITMLMREELLSAGPLHLSLTNVGSPETLNAIGCGVGAGIVAVWNILGSRLTRRP